MHHSATSPTWPRKAPSSSLTLLGPPGVRAKTHTSAHSRNSRGCGRGTDQHNDVLKLPRPEPANTGISKLLISMCQFCFLAWKEVTVQEGSPWYPKQTPSWTISCSNQSLEHSPNRTLEVLDQTWTYQMLSLRAASFSVGRFPTLPLRADPLRGVALSKGVALSSSLYTDQWERSQAWRPGCW